MWTTISSSNNYCTVCMKTARTDESIKNFNVQRANTRRHSKLIVPKLQYYKVLKFIVCLHTENLTAKLHIRPGGEGGECGLNLYCCKKQTHKQTSVRQTI